jgi:hypothetical protein
MEIIPQHTYTYGDGIPAYKSGEWPGSKPSRFTGSKLILKPIKKPEKDFYICNSRHFPQKYSEEFIYNKGVKLVPPVIHEDIYKPKKRPLKPFKTEQKIFFRNKSFNPKDSIFDPNAKIYPLLQRKKRVGFLGKTLTEYNIENMMTKKKRVFTLGEQRNYFKNCKPGDKNYTCSDNSPDFFKEGGLIVGSTNRINLKKTSRKGNDNFYQTVDLNIKILNRNKIWSIRELMESLQFDKAYVKELNNWESKTFEDNKDSKENKDNKGQNKK